MLERMLERGVSRKDVFDVLLTGEQIGKDLRGRGDEPDVCRYDSAMISKPSAPSLTGSRRPSKLGERLAKHKIDDARKLTPEQRLLVALQLSDEAAALHRACSRKR